MALTKEDLKALGQAFEEVLERRIGSSVSSLNLRVISLDSNFSSFKEGVSSLGTSISSLEASVSSLRKSADRLGKTEFGRESHSQHRERGVPFAHRVGSVSGSHWKY